MKRCDKLRKLSWQQRRALLYALLIINVIRLSLWFFSFGMIRQQLKTVLSRWVCSPQTEKISVAFIVQAISIAANYSPGKVKCLARALTAQLLLNRYGYSHNFHIGVTKNESQELEAHAWIEYRGQVIVGELSNLNQFRTLAIGGVKI